MSVKTSRLPNLMFLRLPVCMQNEKLRKLSNRRLLLKIDQIYVGLSDRDVLSKSDPICVLYRQISGRWMEEGRTEGIKNSLNPAWQKKFRIEYRFEVNIIIHHVHFWED